MSDKQPEALSLADAIDHGCDFPPTLSDAAAELRRLHALNAELVEALESIVALRHTESNEWDAVERLIPDMCDIAKAAIAKAQP